MVLPEKFLKSTSPAVQTYIKAKYSQYGYPKGKFIEYNPEYKPDWQSKFDNDRYRWVENIDKAYAGLRFVDVADKIVRLNHTGWYTDNYEGETIHGVVYRLPARSGIPQYVYGINDTENDAACLCFSDIVDDKQYAAHRADDMARIWAERYREEQAKYDAETLIEEITEEIKTLYCDFRKDVRTLRTLPDKAETKRMIADAWEETKAGIEELRGKRRKIEREGMDY